MKEGNVSNQGPSYAYFNGEIVPFEQATISVMNHSLNYGTGAFAGIRGYWNENEQQLFVFRPLDHFKRFLNSARLLCFELDYTPEQLTAVLLDLLRTEGWKTNVYIRPLTYVTSNVIGVRLHGLSMNPSATRSTSLGPSVTSPMPSPARTTPDTT